jgi:class 3 adenylate cyclase
MSETRRIAAILVADVVGYSRLAGVDEEVLSPGSGRFAGI